MLKKLRRGIERSETMAAMVAWVAGAYLNLCNRTIRWQTEGLDDLNAALREGPVILVLWHEHVLMAAHHWPASKAPLSSLYTASPIGRVAGALHRQRGLQPIEMAPKASNLAASRAVLQRAREGVSIGIAADGPLGPARVLKGAALDWARTTGMPVFVYAFATSRGRRLGSWDRMVLPRPFGRGAILYRRLEATLEKTRDDGIRAAQNRMLEDALNTVGCEAAAMSER